MVRVGRRPHTRPVTIRRRYRYVGPAEHRARPPGSRGLVDSADAVTRWVAAQDPADRGAPFTYVVDLRGRLWLAPRRSEHVACAQGADVLAAGEIGFEPDSVGRWSVNYVSNQSTGYCPDLDSWRTVEDALHRAGVRHHAGFTDPFVFRACPTCRAVNIVRDDNFVCAVCDDELPVDWNLDAQSAPCAG